MSKYTIEKGAGSTTWIHVTDKNKKEETLLIELLVCDRGDHDKKRFPEKWLSVHTYVTDSEGRCRGDYDPTIEPYEHGMKIKDDMIFEATEEHKQKLIDECIRLFESAKGKSATQEKIEKCETYAKENNLEIISEKPEGWRELWGLHSPAGSVVITNKKHFREKDYKRALLVY